MEDDAAVIYGLEFQVYLASIASLLYLYVHFSTLIIAYESENITLSTQTNRIGKHCSTYLLYLFVCKNLYFNSHEQLNLISLAFPFA